MHRDRSVLVERRPRTADATWPDRSQVLFRRRRRANDRCFALWLDVVANPAPAPARDRALTGRNPPRAAVRPLSRSSDAVGAPATVRPRRGAVGTELVFGGGVGAVRRTGRGDRGRGATRAQPRCMAV